MLESFLEKIRQNNFAALRGAAISGRVPVRESILNEMLARVRAERDLPTRRLEIRLNATDQFTLFLEPQIGFLHPTIKLDFEIVPDVDFQQDGVLTLRSLGFLGGPTAQLVRTVLLRALKLGDRSVTVERSMIRILLKDALAARGVAFVGNWIRTLRITTRSGMLYVVFSLVV